MTDKLTTDKLTIALTGRPPVTVIKDNWPIIASAADRWFDSEYRSQSFRTTDWRITVRQHQDGRAIVYARYDHYTQYRHERNHRQYAGVLMPAGCTPQQICHTIGDVCEMISAMEHRSEEDARQWRTLCSECIEDMQAEELD